MSAAAQTLSPALDGVTEVAAAAADPVDRDGRFPHEAVGAMRAAGLLGAHVPVELGGAGLDVAGMAQVGFRLGQACASAAMVYAMHQIQVACLVNHAMTTPAQREQLALIAREACCLPPSHLKREPGVTSAPVAARSYRGRAAR